MCKDQQHWHVVQKHSRWSVETISLENGSNTCFWFLLLIHTTCRPTKIVSFSKDPLTKSMPVVHSPKVHRTVFNHYLKYFKTNILKASVCEFYKNNNQMFWNSSVKVQVGPAVYLKAGKEPCEISLPWQLLGSRGDTNTISPPQLSQILISDENLSMISCTKAQNALSK